MLIHQTPFRTSLGIKERQERDREAVRRAILDAARDLFVSEGYHNVSIRKIAEGIEYSPAALYGYFPSKDDIFFALAEEGFRLLGDRVADTEGPPALDALARVRTTFWGLYEFSRDHPQYFALMFVDRSVPRIGREYERFACARERKQRIVKEIEACVDAGVLPAGLNPAVAMRALTVGLVGVAVLSLSERLAPGENADHLAADVLDVTLAGLRAGITLRTISTACPVLEASPNAQAS